MNSFVLHRLKVFLIHKSHHKDEYWTIENNPDNTNTGKHNQFLFPHFCFLGCGNNSQLHQRGHLPKKQIKARSAHSSISCVCNQPFIFTKTIFEIGPFVFKLPFAKKCAQNFLLMYPSSTFGLLWFWLIT